MSISQLSQNLSEYLNWAAFGGERVIVTCRKVPKAVIISIEDLKRLEELEEKVTPVIDLSEVTGRE